MTTALVADAVLVGMAVLVGGLVGANAARILRRPSRARAAWPARHDVTDTQSPDVMSSRVLERAGRVEELTLLLCDIRGFTRLSERLSPSQTVAFVNTYLDAVCPPIVDAGGVIDKFMGDGVLAFFEGGGHAGRALASARRILASVGRLSAGAEGVRVGIALHTGQVLVGTVGPRTRREYTIISDAVNTVARLEELNKTYGSAVVASAATISELSEGDRAGFAGPLEVALRGREAPVQVHVLR